MRSSMEQVDLLPAREPQSVDHPLADIERRGWSGGALVVTQPMPVDSSAAQAVPVSARFGRGHRRTLEAQKQNAVARSGQTFEVRHHLGFRQRLLNTLVADIE